MKKRRKKSRSEIWDLVKKIWEIIKKILGVIFIVIGIFGLFLPLLQGILLILIGLALYNNKKIGRYVVENIAKIKRKIKKAKDLKVVK
jgi:amino acid transporter